MIIFPLISHSLFSLQCSHINNSLDSRYTQASRVPAIDVSKCNPVNSQKRTAKKLFPVVQEKIYEYIIWMKSKLFFLCLSYRFLVVAILKSNPWNKDLLTAYCLFWFIHLITFYQLKKDDKNRMITSKHLSANSFCCSCKLIWFPAYETDTQSLVM